MAKNEDYWRGVIEEYRRSGATPSEFCRRKGVDVRRLYYWRRRFDVVAEPGTGFVKVGGKEPLEVEFAGGVRLRVVEGFDEALLRHLIEVLRAAG